MPVRVVVAGATGWVGRALIPAITTSRDLALVGAVARTLAGRDAGEAIGAPRSNVVLVRSLEEALECPSDVVVDYTKPDAVKANVLLALRSGRHVVVGTSGLSAEDYAEIDGLAQEAGRGVVAPGNFAITAALLKRFALLAAEHVADVEIIDYASPGKPDTPSGTARDLAEALAARRLPPTTKPVAELTGIRETRGAAVGSRIPVQVHSLRLPSFVLSCEAVFGAADERLTIRHDAGSSAAPYVAGTLLAIRKVSTIVGVQRDLDSLIG